MMRSAIALGLSALAIAGCQSAPDNGTRVTAAAPAVYQPAPGSNGIFREALSAAPGAELILADLVLGPDAVGAAHSHPREEYLYVLGGSTVVDLVGGASTTLSAGETFVIPAGVVHIPRAGPEGVRAIVARVHRADEPLSIPAK